MDKGFGGDDSSSSSMPYSNSSSSSSSRDMYLKHVNRNSHKISKPVRRPLPLPAAVSSSSSSAIPVLDPNPQLSAQPQPQPQSQQPPVYNINKNDFRDVVQKLTGSPAHERNPTPPPPATQSRPPSSRLQRIRPPPLAQISNRPPQLAQIFPRPQDEAGQRAAVQPFTPLPPLPSVHPAAESPISAYMRFLQSSSASRAPSPLLNGAVGPRPDSPLLPNDVSHRAAQPQPFSPLLPAESPVSAYMRFLQNSYSLASASPRCSVVGPPQQPPLLPQQEHPPVPPSASCPSPFPVLPLSPLPFGCIPSPRSPYGTLFSPTGQLGLPQLPLSPTLPVPSPRWKGM
ncbi:VQ motif-containing protein 9 [Sesamum angolense]|uniref:VQ motif-containing protein 9 n=1 Tax=Sesamum angolense TaxID=2727404 RepID=A0AAE1WBD9_9LAMI|nr:VQ motif-containing protein 9 [Sesamum angolense]